MTRLSALILVAGVLSATSSASAFASEGRSGGTFTGTYLSGVFSYTPLEGDCITTPMTRTVARHIAHGNAPAATIETHGLGA